MSAQRFVLVRHGQSLANREGWLAGHEDVGLTELGEAQARALAEPLAGLDVRRAFSSDLRRAVDTARLALEASALPVQQVRALRERDAGAWAGRDRLALRQQGQLARLLTWEGRPPGGESQRDLAVRALPWFIALTPAAGATLVVAHGGLLRVLLGLLEGGPLEDIGLREVDNATLHVVDVEPGGWEGAMARALG